MITYIDAQGIMNRVFKDCHDLREAGQREYAHTHTNALANFERVAAAVGVSREQALFTYLQKHLDGISAYIKGHRSQREDVRGRINDAIVYLCLLRCMVEDNDMATSSGTWRKGINRKGEANPNVRLTAESVKRIRESYRDLVEGLAMMYGVTEDHIARVIRGKRWNSSSNQ